MKSFEYVSPSQISTYRSCNRQWYYQSILGIRAPQKPSAALGEAVHGQLERYMLDGTPPNLSTEAGKIASTGLRFLPPPAECDVELDIGKQPVADKLLIEGIRVTGRIDLLRWKGVAVPEVIDHKTTSNLKYALTEDELEDDPQILIYAGFLFAHLQHHKVWDGRQLIRARHIVYGTRAPYTAKETKAFLSYDHVRTAWATHLRDTVAAMKETAILPSVVDATPNYSACSKYGGCFFRDKCEAMKPKGGHETMSLLNIVKGIPAATPTPAPSPAKPAASVLPPDAPPRNEAQAPTVVRGLLFPESIPGSPAETPAQPSLLGGVRKQAADERAHEAEERAAIQSEREQIYPIRWEERLLAAGRKREDIVLYTPKEAAEALAEVAREALAKPEPEAAPTPAPAEEKPKRAKKTAAEPEPPPAPTRGKGLTLYVDCFPERGRDTEFTLLEDLIKPWAEQICQQENVPHWSLVPYNRGPAFLCAKALASPPTGILVVQTRQPSAAALLEVLRPMANVIIRGW